MLNRRVFAAAAIGLLAGCGGSEPAPLVQRKKPSRDPRLTDDDVALFLEVVKALPRQKPPEFQPATELDLTTDASATELASRWQREFRSAYSPQIQGKLWRRDAELRRAIEDQGLEPEDLARLLVKLSTAVVRESLDPRMDLPQMGRQADHAIRSLCTQLDQLDTDQRMSPNVRNSRTEFLTTVLKESVAYREFLRLLEAVPAESLATASQHRDVLRRLLPASGAVQAFERRLESEATVIQASHASPAIPRTSR